MAMLRLVGDQSLAFGGSAVNRGPRRTRLRL